MFFIVNPCLRLKHESHLQRESHGVLRVELCYASNDIAHWKFKKVKRKIRTTYRNTRFLSALRFEASLLTLYILILVPQDDELGLPFFWQTFRSILHTKTFISSPQL